MKRTPRQFVAAIAEELHITPDAAGELTFRAALEMLARERHERLTLRPTGTEGGR